MPTIQLINKSSVSAKDLATMVDALNQFVPKVTSAWGFTSANVTSQPTPGAWLVYVTDEKRKSGTGWHGVENGVPVAYCSPTAAHRVFGYYAPASYSKLTKQLRTPERFEEGLVTTIAHEIAEMLVDPFVNDNNKFSKPDGVGRAWLVEICDHVFGSYFTITSFGQICVMPDVTTASFYDLNGHAPFSINNSVHAPFTLSPKGYGFYKNLDGSLHKL